MNKNKQDKILLNTIKEIAKAIPKNTNKKGKELQNDIKKLITLLEDNQYEK